jgi:hypothetical protein
LKPWFKELADSGRWVVLAFLVIGDLLPVLSTFGRLLYTKKVTRLRVFFVIFVLELLGGPCDMYTSTQSDDVSADLSVTSRTNASIVLKGTVQYLLDISEFVLLSMKVYQNLGSQPSLPKVWKFIWGGEAPKMVIFECLPADLQLIFERRMRGRLESAQRKCLSSFSSATHVG